MVAIMSVTLKVDGRTLSLPLPRDHYGFTGIEPCDERAAIVNWLRHLAFGTPTPEQPPAELQFEIRYPPIRDLEYVDSVDPEKRAEHASITVSRQYADMRVPLFVGMVRDIRQDPELAITPRPH